MYFAIFTDLALFLLYIQIFEIFENPHAKFEFPMYVLISILHFGKK